MIKRAPETKKSELSEPEETKKNPAIDCSLLVPLRTAFNINSSEVDNDRVKCLSIIKSQNSPIYWHKFTIIQDLNCVKEYSKLFMLVHVTTFLYPCDLLPVYTIRKNNKLVFLARNCMDAIIKLVENKMIIPNPMEPEYPFSVEVVKDLTTTKSVPAVVLEENIVEVLTKKESGGMIDLSRFHEEEDLEEFCPLFQPKVLSYIFCLIPKAEKVLRIYKMILCFNEIRTLPYLPDDYQLYTDIDLGDNNIEDIKDIKPLETLPNLLYLRLDGNPLCAKFESCESYITAVKTICTKLQILDSKHLADISLIRKQKNFLCDPKGYNLVRKFVEDYFTCFDNNRKLLYTFYHDEAVLSYSHKAQTNFYDAGHQALNVLVLRSRNILECGRSHANFLYTGKEAISYQFVNIIPPIEHRPYTFTVDLMHYSENRAIITITGVFMDKPAKKSKNIISCGFIRTFVLTSTIENNWLITNDIWHSLKKDLIYALPVPQPSVTSCLFPQSSNSAELELLVDAFARITGLTNYHSKRYIKRNNSNFEYALNCFIDEHVNDEIPEDHFVRTQDDSSDSSSVEIIDDNDDQ